MRRKVIQIANSTQLISLPRKWAQQNNIKKGDELELDIRSNSLVVTCDHQRQQKAIDLDVSTLDKTSILHYIRALYRRGYDEISIFFKNQTALNLKDKQEERVLSIIQKEVSQLNGMEIIKQAQNLCTIKCISEPSSKEFETVLRRVFLLLSDAFKDFVTGIKKKDKLLLESMQDRHDTITKFISYCIRLINTSGYDETENFTFLHHLLGTLDAITDILKYTSRKIIDFEGDLNTKSVAALVGVVETFNDFYKLYYTFKPATLKEFSEKRYELRTILDALTKKNPQELRIIEQFSQVTQLLLEAVEIRIAIEH